MSSPCEKTLDSRKRPRSPSPPDASSSDQHEKKQHESVQSLASSPATPRDSGQRVRSTSSGGLHRVVLTRSWGEEMSSGGRVRRCLLRAVTLRDVFFGR
ncbi:hypothetical protein BDZ89DRAFT_1076614 [Hymenopellis radicata]|nr:hypothetical protein BDZ89DRAFT_1080934 [Hymenopellis radicata]KAF9014494.1 hypothetical protein BDZ89DRAFT_1076614 [Hymenopellis radicata]